MNADRPSSLFRFPNKLSGLQIGRAPFAQARLCLIPWIREKGFSTHANEPNDNWSFQLNNNRPDRRGLGLHAKPDFYRLDVALKSPPGVYYAPRFGRKTRDERLLYDLIQAHLNSSSKGYEIMTNLGAAVLAQFPKSKNVRISVNPYIRGRFGLPGLTAVTLAYSIPSTYTGRRWSNYDPSVLVKTDWRLDVTKGSGVGLIDLGVSSVESPMSQLPSLLESPHRIGGDTYGQDPEANLGRLHPTFYMHQELMRSITVFQSDFGAAAALHFAKLGFDFADKQYMDKRLGSVTVGIKKVRSDPNEPSSACNISLSRTRYEQTKNSMIHSNLQPRWHRAYLALGSNVGDRLSMIEAACSEMNDRGIRISRTSALYETPAMYLEDQQSFINGACEIETTLSPTELLDTLKEIEAKLGRVKTIDNGPRTIDLDILMYGEEILESDRLVIPHKRMFEREFVLRPLCDLIPNTVPPIPDAIATFKDELENLPRTEDQLSPLTPLSSHLTPISSQSPTRSTRLMAVLNLTPDSFSDGGLHSTTEPASLFPPLQDQMSQDNSLMILDIGGQSTRPHAPEVSPQEELSRILPSIKAIRSDSSFNKLVVSVDTYRASVAAAAVDAGADIINDVSAGQLDPDMLSTIARSGCTCILMHMRGTPDTMSKMTDYPGGIVNGVGNELLARVGEAEKAGIRRWRIMLDPGIGFAKTQAQNIELLRRFSDLREFDGLRGFPWVVGASRKGFIGKITGVEEASKRGWGTAAAVAAAIQGGADVVRVHDVKEMGEVAKMADAIWRA